MEVIPISVYLNLNNKTNKDEKSNRNLRYRCFSSMWW